MSQTPVPQARQLARLGDDAALLHAPQHPDCTLRSRLESFVHDCFADTYGANVRQFMPELLGLCQQGTLQAGVGIRGGASGPLFLEHYLDQPVCEAIRQHTG